MKITKLFLMTFAFFALLLVSNLNAKFSGGSGTEADPYQITSREDMEEVADSVNKVNINFDNWSTNKHFILMNDITDSVRTVIAKEFLNLRHFVYLFNKLSSFAFRGTFDGQGHTITLAINHKLEDTNVATEGTINSLKTYSSLFGYVENATIKNIAVTGYINGIDVTGIVGLVGKNTTISNCINSANLTTEYWAAGICGDITGLTKPNNIIIKNCIKYWNY